MAAKHLSPETMIELSGAWLDPARLRPALERFMPTRALLPKIEEVHNGVVHTHSANPAASTGPIKTISDEQNKLDVLHDRKLRGTIHVLTGLADLTDDPAEAKGYLDLRDRLAPLGFASTVRSYMDEAGDARLLEGRLDADSTARLQSIVLPTGKLSDDVTAWTVAANQLGALETKKSEIETAATVTPGQQLTARNMWIRTTNLLVATLEGHDEIDAATADQILGPFRREEAKATKRETKSKKKDPVETAPPKQDQIPAAVQPAPPKKVNQ